MIKLFWFYRNKWIKRHCRHYCLTCEHRKEHFKECWNDLAVKEFWWRF